VSVERVEQILAHTGAPEPDETPITTIAWRLGHLHFHFAGGWAWTFGERRQEPKRLVEFTPSAALALQRFWAVIDRWRDSVAAVTDEQLATVGSRSTRTATTPTTPTSVCCRRPTSNSSAAWPRSPCSATCGRPASPRPVRPPAPRGCSVGAEHAFAQSGQEAADQSGDVHLRDLQAFADLLLGE